MSYKKLIDNEENKEDEKKAEIFSSGNPRLRDLLQKPKQIPAANLDESSSKTVPSNFYTNTLLAEVQKKVIDSLDSKYIRNMNDIKVLENYIGTILDNICNLEFPSLTRREKLIIIKSIIDELFGMGPLQQLLLDDSITEIMVNNYEQVYVEKNGKILLSDVKFRNNEHVLQIIDKIVSPLGRRIDESSPMVDARLPNGSRVNAIIPPVSLKGPAITIRKFSSTPLTIDKLISFNSLTDKMAKFIEAAVKAKANIVVAGGTGSGKTTFLNVLSSFIPHDERIITIEDAAELQLMQSHVISLEARPSNLEGIGEISIRDLLKNCLRMRPDRIVIGEVRGSEALDMLQAMNTGHNGSMSTIHANSPRDALSRLETMALYSGIDFPLKAISQQISSALDLIIYIERLPDGTRKITNITEVLGMEGDTITLQDIFYYEKMGKTNGKLHGQFRDTSIRPKILDKISSLGINLEGWKT